MNKLTGYGMPTPSTVGQVGQYYEDLNTGNLYECRISSKYSPTHGWPVGGYVWELRATGEDVRELYGSGSGGSGGAQPDWNQNDPNAPDYVNNRPLWTGEPVETTILPEQILTTEDMDGYYIAELSTALLNQ